jgi:DNA-directed RNA polymerase specialized sigma24 family protein
MRPLIDTRVLRPAESALALNLLTEMELLKLKAIARLHARGLPPDVGWDDLLQEALTRVLVGSRVQPEGISMVQFVAGIMRSLRSEHWRRASGRSARGQMVPIDATNDEDYDMALTDPAPTAERSLSARQEITAIASLFMQDRICLQIIQGLGQGLSAEQIRSVFSISRTDYDSARKRMRRTLLKEGLTCEPK